MADLVVRVMTRQKPGTVRLCVTVPASLVDALDVECEIAGVGRPFAVRAGIQAWIDARIQAQLGGRR
jgi:hypothetical protein